MTLKQAKEADQVLSYLVNNMSKDVDFKEMHDLIIDLSEDKKLVSNPYNLIDLFIADGFILKTYYERPYMTGNYYLYRITENASPFLNFERGYCKIIEDENKEKSKENRKYWFDIAKDVLLIILSIVSVVISIIYAEN